MLLVLQFPIADLRSFVDAPDTRLRAVTDFAAIASQLGGRDDGPRPYIRHMGPLRRRQQGLDIAGEVFAFRGHRALRWAAGLSAVPHPRDGSRVPMRLRFRRFQPFADGRDGGAHRLARYELGWMLELGNAEPAALTPAELDRLVDTCLALPVSLAQYDAPGHWMRDVPLRDAGPWLARQLRWATVAKPHAAVDLPPEWTVQACKPALLVELGQAELSGDPAGALPASFPAAPDVRVHCRERRLGGQSLQCWTLRSPRASVDPTPDAASLPPEQAQPLRHLRVAVLRQHAEREVLACVLGALALPGRLQADGTRSGDPGSAAGVQLREYLLNGAALLARRQRQQRQLPIGLEPAADAVDEADPERRRRVQHQLAMVLGPETLASLRDALALLPMGSLEADEQIAALAAAHRPAPLHVAVSYAHVDERDTRLLTGLRHATHRDALEGSVHTWTDLRIDAGAPFHEAIEEAFNQADVIVLLLSPAFLASPYCMEREVPLALELARQGRAAVLPVEMVPCDWTSTALAAELQVLRPWGQALTACGNRLAAWAVVRHAIYRAGVRLAQRRAGASRPARAQG